MVPPWILPALDGPTLDPPCPGWSLPGSSPPWMVPPWILPALDGPTLDPPLDGSPQIRPTLDGPSPDPPLDDAVINVARQVSQAAYLRHVRAACTHSLQGIFNKN